MPQLRFGKHAPKLDYRTLRFKSYLTPLLAVPPLAYDALVQVYQNLGTNNPAVLFPMDGNDTLGDCTIAGIAHADTVFNGRVGNQIIMAQQDVVKLYFQLTGGADTGLSELDVLNYWQSNTVSGDRISAFTKIDPKNHLHIQQAIQLFGGVYLGFQVQQNAVADFNAHTPWTPGVLTPDGHAVFAVAYDATGVTVLTWGSTQQATWAWWDECVDEAYAILPPEALRPGFAPGFDYAALAADLNAVAG